MTDDSPIPKWPNRIAAVVVVASLAGAFAWMNISFIRQTNAVNQFQQLPPMSGFPVVIAEPGLYTIWAGAACNGFCRPDTPERYHAGLTVGFEKDGRYIAPVPKHRGQHYMLGSGREGRAVWLVEFDEAGTYTLDRRRHGDVGSATLLLGKGDGIPAGVLPGVVTIGVVGGGLALGLAVYGWRRKRQAYDKMMESVTW
jgi:hypothetical protein